jgi:hypothetical protein
MGCITKGGFCMGIVSDRINQFSKSSAVNSGMTWGDVGAILVSGRPVRRGRIKKCEKRKAT